MLAVSAIAADRALAPDFTLNDLAGSTVTLSKQRGKVVFLKFWATWCPSCRHSIPAVEKLSKKYKDSDVIFLSINTENNAEKVKKFAVRNGITYRILQDTADVTQNYNVHGIPAFFIIDQKGKIIESYAGFSPGMEAEWEELINTSLAASKRLPPPSKPKNNAK